MVYLTKELSLWVSTSFFHLVSLCRLTSLICYTLCLSLIYQPMSFYRQYCKILDIENTETEIHGCWLDPPFFFQSYISRIIILLINLTMNNFFFCPKYFFERILVIQNLNIFVESVVNNRLIVEDEYSVYAVEVYN